MKTETESGTQEAITLHSLVSRPYSDWFGKGDTKDDVMVVVRQHGEPQEVLLEETGYMACVIYADRVVVVGYDGSECCHTFEFSRTQAANDQSQRPPTDDVRTR